MSCGECLHSTFWAMLGMQPKVLRVMSVCSAPDHHPLKTRLPVLNATFILVIDHTSENVAIVFNPGNCDHTLIL